MVEAKAAGNSELKKLAIYLFLVAIGWLLPSMGPITEIGMKVIFVFIAVIYGWSASAEIWPSLLGVLLLPLTGVITLPEMIAGGWGLEIGLFTALLFILIAYLEEEKVGQFISAWLLSRKILRGHPWRFLFMLFLAAYAVCSLTNLLVGVFVFWSITYSVSKTLGFKPFEKFPTLVVLGIAIMGALSLSAFPWGGNSIILLAVFGKMLGTTLDIGKYLTYTLPYDFVVMASYLLLCKYVFRLDVSKLRDLDMSFIKPEDLELTPNKKVALAALAAFITLLVLPIIFPKTWPLIKFLAGLGYAGKLITVFVVLFMIKINNKPVFNFGQLAAKGIQWTMMGIVMVVVPMGGCLNSPATGINTFISQVLLPIFNGMPPLAFIISITLVTVLLTNFLANMPVAMLILPVATGVAASYGIAAEQIGYLIIVACTIAWMTAASSPAGMVLYSNKDWIRPKDILKFGLPTIIVVSLIAVLMNYYWLGLFY